MHAEVVRHGSANQDSCTDTDIPAAQISAVGGASLVVAGEVHAHGLVTRENQAETGADQECRDKEGGGCVTHGENEVGDNVQRHAGSYQVNQVTPVDEFARHDAVHDKPCGNEGVEPAGTADAQFLGVEGDVVGYWAVGETHENEVHELRNGAGQKETVQRKGGVGLLFFRGDFQCLHQNQSDDAERNGNHENDGVAKGFVQEHACHGARCKCQVHADAEIADSFAAAAGGQGVDGDRIARGTGNSEEQAVQKADHGKNHDDADRLVAHKAGRECEECPEIQGLAAQGVHQESGEGPAGQRANRIKRNDDARRRIVGLEFVDNVERENR